MLSRICVPTYWRHNFCGDRAVAWCWICHQGLCIRHIEQHYRQHNQEWWYDRHHPGWRA